MIRKVEKVHTFIDYYKNKVTLSFADHPFSKHPKHVWVVCKYKDQWLLTKHKERGLEFPGGKVEDGETAEQGAIREIQEETGGVIDSIHYIGQYYVAGKKEHVIKNVYFAKIKQLIEQHTYFETEGPVLLKEIPKNVRHNKLFSFIMKDDVLSRSMDQINKKYIRST